MSSGEGYNPERDPNWQYQGRTPRQVGSSQVGFMIILGGAALLMFAAAIYLFIEHAQFGNIAWPLG